MGSGASVASTTPPTSKANETGQSDRHRQSRHGPPSNVVQGSTSQNPDNPDPAPGRARDELSLLSILRDPMLHTSFRRWLEKHHAESLLHFWVDCDDYGNLPDGDTSTLRPRARAIFKRYLDPGCPQHISLDEDTCDIIARAIHEGGREGTGTTLLPDSAKLHDVYHGAMMAAFEILRSDFLPGFLVSRSVGLLTDRSYGSESDGGGGKSNDDRTQRSEERDDRRTADNNKVTLANAFLENPDVVFHLKRYLVSLPAAESEPTAPKPSKHLECLEEIRDFQHAPTLEHRQRRWAIIQRRYCGEGGIAIPSLEALRTRAQSGDDSLAHPAASMLDNVYEDIVETIMTRHLANYEPGVHSEHLEKSCALGRADSMPALKFSAEVSACVGRHSPNRRFLPASANRTQTGLSPSVASRIYRRRSVNDIPLSGRRSRSTSMESEERVVGQRESNGACLQPSTRGLPRGFRNSRKGDLASIQAGLTPRDTPNASPSPHGPGSSAVAEATAHHTRNARRGAKGDPTEGPPSCEEGDPGDPSSLKVTGKVPFRSRREIASTASLGREETGTPQGAHGVEANGMKGGTNASDGGSDGYGGGVGGGGEGEGHLHSTLPRVRPVANGLLGGKPPLQRSQPKEEAGKGGNGGEVAKCTGADNDGGADNDDDGGGSSRTPVTGEKLRSALRDNSSHRRHRPESRGEHEDNSFNATDTAAAPSPGKRESIDFHTLLEDPLGLSLLRRYSHELFQEENINLWVEINDFKGGQYAVPHSGQALEVGEGDSLLAIQARRARMIFDSYISAKSGTQVNLSCTLREKVEHDVEELERAAAKEAGGGESGDVLSVQGRCDLFDAIQREIFQLMELNLWTTFRQSKRYDFFVSKYRVHQARRNANRFARPSADGSAGTYSPSSREVRGDGRYREIIRCNFDDDRTRSPPSSEAMPVASRHRLRLHTPRIMRWSPNVGEAGKGREKEQHDKATSNRDDAKRSPRMPSTTATTTRTTTTTTARTFPKLSVFSSARLALGARTAASRRAELSHRLTETSGNYGTNTERSNSPDGISAETVTARSTAAAAAALTDTIGKARK